MDMSFVYINAQRIISKVLLVLILVFLSGNSIADDKKLDANDIHHPAISVGNPSDVDILNYFDNEKNLNKLAEKISSNKEKRDTLEILDKVNSFYSNSFSSLQTIIIAMIGIVGVVIPLIISAYQARVLKRQTINLQKIINNEVSAKLLELKQELYADNERRMLNLENDVKKIIEKMEDEYKSEIKNLRAESLARINHLSAATCILTKEYKTSALFYFDAGLNYMEYKNHYNLRRAIDSLINDVIKNISSNDKDSELNESYKEFITELSLFNTDSIYSDAIADLKSSWMDFEKRIETKNND